MNELRLFTDGSVNTRSHVGYGAYLVVSDRNLSLDALAAQVKVKRFEQTSSVKLELQTLLWALGEVSAAGVHVTVYTDSQNILGLPGRRERIEKNHYRSQKNRLLNNAELYREFFKMTDRRVCKFVKVRGHLGADQKNDIDRLFALVDRASRKALREESR